MMKNSLALIFHNQAKFLYEKTTIHDWDAAYDGHLFRAD